MTEQIYYEDISEGMGIPSLLVHPDPVQLVKFAGASGDYHPIHFSNEAALARGLPGIIIYGKMRSALLCQLLTDWIGSQGRLVGISVQQRDIDRVDTDLICTGTVTGQRQNGDDYLVDCDIWIENEEKARTVVGTSVVALPSKSQNA